MTDKVDVRAIHALDDLRGVLVRFRGEAQAALREMEVAIRHVQQHLAEREAYWKRQVTRWEAEHKKALAALAMCRSRTRRDQKTGRTYVPLCTQEQEWVTCTRVELERATTALRTVREWRRAVERTVEEYRRQARRLAAHLEENVPKATARLERHADTLRAYTAITSAASTFITTPSVQSAVDTVAKDASLLMPVNAIQEHEFQNAPLKHKDAYEEVNALLENSREGRQFLRYLSKRGTSVRALWEGHRKEFDMPTRVAGLAQDAGLDAVATGRIVHRMAELYTLYTKRQEVKAGKRLVEHRVNYVDSDGKERHIEIDAVIIKGNKHYIRDYKPLNLAKFEKTEQGQRWAKWMEKNVGPDFREQIRMGELNPLLREDMPKDLRAALHRFLRGEVRAYRDQLESYREVYMKTYGLRPENVPRPHVRPYFTYWV